MSKCKDCKHFIPLTNECNQVDYEINRDDVSCDKFVQRKECKHRYENCDCNGCSIICHSYPSERGCDFYYECKLDNRSCDENCEKHEIRHEIKVLEDERGKLYDAATAINLSLTRYSDKIIELNEKLKKLENKQEE